MVLFDDFLIPKRLIKDVRKQVLVKNDRLALFSQSKTASDTRLRKVYTTGSALKASISPRRPLHVLQCSAPIAYCCRSFGLCSLLYTMKRMLL